MDEDLTSLFLIHIEKRDLLIPNSSSDSKTTFDRSLLHLMSRTMSTSPQTFIEQLERSVNKILSAARQPSIYQIFPNNLDGRNCRVLLEEQNYITEFEVFIGLEPFGLIKPCIENLLDILEDLIRMSYDDTPFQTLLAVAFLLELIW